MTSAPRQTNSDSPVAMANLARSYRTMARLMVTQESRDELLRMAATLEEKSRKKLSAASG
jgi:hypothetical protein